MLHYLADLFISGLHKFPINLGATYKKTRSQNKNRIISDGNLIAVPPVNKKFWKN
jgi:hypothetical protein